MKEPMWKMMDAMQWVSGAFFKRGWPAKRRKRLPFHNFREKLEKSIANVMNPKKQQEYVLRTALGQKTRGLLLGQVFLEMTKVHSGERRGRGGHMKEECFFFFFFC